MCVTGRVGGEIVQQGLTVCKAGDVERVWCPAVNYT